MVDDDTDLYPSSMGQDVIIENEYETVVINYQDESTLGDTENNSIVQEIYETDLSVEHYNSVWCDKSVHYLIHCRSQLNKQFKICPDLKKKSLWEHVSECMIEQGFYFDAETCETKWQDLKQMYMYHKTNIKVDEDKNVNGIDLKENTYDNINIVTKREHFNTTNGKNNKKLCEWTIKSTKKLIQMYGKSRKNFSVVNQQEKRILWEEIAQQFLQLGYNYSAITCHNKWRNLKNTFQQKKQIASKRGSKYIRWVYYKDIDNIIKNLPKEKSNLNDIISLTSNDDELNNVKIKNEDLFNINSNFQTPDDVIIQNNNGEGNTGSLKIWTEAATECLIKLRSLYHKRFLMAPYRKKRLLWNVISDQLRKNGHNYSDLACNRKWYLLKKKYLKLKQTYNKLGTIPVKWEYYQDLDRILGASVKSISWSLDSINYLIDCYDFYKEKIMYASKRQKLLIWKQISKKMSQNGFNFSSKTCYNKWLTLKNCYIKNRMCFNRNKKVIWVHYNKMDSVMKGIKKKKLRHNGTNKDNASNQSYENNESHEDNYVKTKTNSSFFKEEALTELKDMITLKYTKLNQKFEKIEDELSRREKLFVDIGERTLNALDKLNELEAHLLRLLEQLILKLPNATLSQIIL